MLTTVAIRGYRSLRDIVLPLAQLTVITGANGTGKSSLYRALQLLADCGRGEIIGSLARQGGLQSAMWAGPESLNRARRTESFRHQAHPPGVDRTGLCVNRFWLPGGSRPADTQRVGIRTRPGDQG